MKPGDLFLLKLDPANGGVNAWNRSYGGRIIMFLQRTDLDASYTTSEFLIEGRIEFFADSVMNRWSEPLLGAE